MTKTYSVAEGVSWVNGQAVPEAREMTLTDEAARFDLAHGRIVEKPSEVPEPVADVAAPVAVETVEGEAAETRKPRR